MWNDSRWVSNQRQRHTNHRVSSGPKAEDMIWQTKMAIHMPWCSTLDFIVCGHPTTLANISYNVVKAIIHHPYKLMVYNTHKNGKWDVGSYCFTNIVDNWPTPWNGQMALSLISSQSIDGFERQGQLPATIAPKKIQLWWSRKFMYLAIVKTGTQQVSNLNYYHLG